MIGGVMIFTTSMAQPKILRQPLNNLNNDMNNFHPISWKHGCFFP